MQALSRNYYYYIMLMESCNMSANNDETRFSGDHNSPCDGKTALLSVFRTHGSFYPPFIIRGGGVAVNFQYQPRDFFSIRSSYSNVFPLDLVRKLRGKEQERERERETGGTHG